MRYLVDTGVWLRLFDRSDPKHPIIRRALSELRQQGHELATCPQNIAEFWNVSTRPMSARGGYGRPSEMFERRVQFIERFATVLKDSAETYRTWRSILSQYSIQGVAVHDARLVAMMQVVGID